MKKIIIVLIIFLLIGGGYYFFTRQPDKLGEHEESLVSGSFLGIVTKVDLDAMAYDGPALITAQNSEGGTATIAVPSMGLPLCVAFESITSVGLIEVNDTISVEGDVDIEGNIVPCSDLAHHVTVTAKVRDEMSGYEFTYLKGPDGYIFLENTESQDVDFVSGVMLMNRNEYEELQNSTDAREGPPAMHVRVYNNPENLSAFIWPEQNSHESNIGLAFEDPVEEVVGGANASFYTADGLYPIDTYVVANGQYVYLLTGAYLDKESDIYNDFRTLIDSFTFIQSADQN